MTGDQVREARRLLGLAAATIAARCSMPTDAVSVFERTGKLPKPQGSASSARRLEKLKGVLEAAGVVFTDGEEPGVRLRKADR